MSTYRLYLVSNFTTRFEPAYAFEAVDDETAIEHAEGARLQRAAELWDRDRLVKQWVPQSPRPQPVQKGPSQPLG